MVKKMTTVYVDSEVLELAKVKIPNISAFFEKSLKEYLQIPDSKEEIDKKIGNLGKELAILKEKRDVVPKESPAETQKKVFEAVLFKYQIDLAAGDADEARYRAIDELVRHGWRRVDAYNSLVKTGKVV